MNHSRIPWCSHCKSNYHVVGDTYGQKIPMLLPCGHDMCKNCLKFLFRKNKKVICATCQEDTMIKCEDEVLNTPIHYYLMGKALFLSSNKQKGIYRDIYNLKNVKMETTNTESYQKNKKNCSECQKCAIFFCQQCNEVYCEKCSQEAHLMNQLMSQHELDRIHFTDPELPLESSCYQHSKLMDFICVTCDFILCPICAVENHKHHDVQHLEKYNKNEMERLNEYTSKGEILLRKLKFHRNKFYKKIQHSQVVRKKKNNDCDIKKQNVSMFVSSVIGALQSLEYNFLNLLDESDKAITDSMDRIMNQLDNLIEDLQEKLNQIDSLFKKNQNSCIKMSPGFFNVIDIERILDATYYIAKKDRTEISIMFNKNIFETIKECIVYENNVSDTYILTNSPELPLNYKLTSTIEVTDNALERPSSVSSCVSTTSSYASIPSSDVFKLSKFSHPSVKEISHNVMEYVVITHLNSPSDFFVQLLDNNEIITMIADELNKFVLTEQSVVDTISMNNVMYAIQALNNRWYRGIVVNINYSEDNNCLYTVHFIDYGFTDILPADRIKNVPACIILIPSLAYNCALYDLKPSTVTGWSYDAYNLFTELALEKTGLFYIQPMDLSGERIKVDLIWKDCMYPLSIRDAMFFLGHGSSAEIFVNKELHEELINLISLPSNIQLEEGKEYPVLLHHLVTPFEFYMRVGDEETSDLLEEIMSTLETIYKPTEVHPLKSYLLYTPQIGMVVAARYSIDSNWYRAQIVSLPESRMVTVFYIDFGNSETLPWDQLRVLDKSLIKTPPLAIKASLIDIEPAIDGIESDKWSSQSCTEFMNLLCADHVQEKLSALIQKIDGDTHKVVLYSFSLRGEVCVNSQLINLGHATTLHPNLCVFNKQNTRNFTSKSSLHVNSRGKKLITSSANTLEFVNQRSVIEHKSHKMSINNSGSPMLVIKIVSPDEITLKNINCNTTDLTERLNKVYLSKNKKIKKTNWKKNDLCAVYIHKFGNWYRGKIMKLDIEKKTATIYLYDLDETYDEVPLENLNFLKQNFAEEKCEILHCSMYNLVPLGVSDGKWSKFSCDRLIEELKKYPHIYFLKRGNQGNKVLGEIWVKDVDSPQALEPLNERWINMNKFMIEQGFALSKKQANKDDEYISTLSKPEFYITSETLKNDSSIHHWLPPISISSSKFNAIVTFVDKKGLIYFQCLDNDTSQLLQNVLDELNIMFMNSKPEPINYKWTNGQMVIVKYHLDKLWYRGIIIKIKNNIYTVQFVDYGNIEDCTHEDLRSTLYMTDIPQLCATGFFNNIIPITKDHKWSTVTLDFIHFMIVDKPLQVTVDLEVSKENMYAIDNLKSDQISDICQYLVTNNHAYFASVDKSKLQFFDHPISNDTSVNYDDNSTECSTTRYEKYSKENIDVDCSYSLHSNYTSGIYQDEIYSRILQSSNADAEQKIVENTDNYNTSVINCNVHIKLEENNKKNENNCCKNEFDYESCTNKTIEEEEEVGYSKFCLELGDEIEGTLCSVVKPTQMTLMITKIGGVCMSKCKDEMHNIMFEKCPKLPVLNQFTPGTAVVILYKVLWRRGIIVNDGDSVHLVDLGLTIKLIKKNVKLCPKEFFHLPMLSINCQLANVELSKNADAKDVIQKMSNLLRGVQLKITGIDKLDEDVISVELYNDLKEIAYQPLIEKRLLIPKN